VNINDCTDTSCLNGGTCVDGVNSYSCNCAKGYEGTQCETITNNCSPNPCQNGGTCVNAIGSYSCTCTNTGYTGKNCQTKACEDIKVGRTFWPKVAMGSNSVGSCDPNYYVFAGDKPSISQNLRKCISDDNGEPVWSTNFTECEESCVLKSCENSGVCSSSTGAPFCDCVGTGFAGRFCENVSVIKCANIQCLNGGKCVESTGTCDCTGTLFTGNQCQSESITCNPNPCFNGGSCSRVGVNTISCSCNSTRYAGQYCQLDKSDCTSYPCQNGGICNSATKACYCEGTGFNGLACSEEATVCNEKYCNTGKCARVDVNKLSCNCGGTRFVGTRCEIDLSVIFGIALSVVVVIIIYIFLRRYYPHAHNSIVIVLYFALLDFITDCLFVNSQSGKEEKNTFYASLTFLVVPILFNLITVCFIFYRELAYNMEMQTWISNNYPFAAGLAVISATNVDSLTALESRFLSKPWLDAPISQDFDNAIKIASLVGVFLEDIPQLIIQAYVAFSEPSTIVLISILASVLTITFSLFKKAILLALIRFGAVPDSNSKGGTIRKRLQPNGQTASEMSVSTGSVINMNVHPVTEKRESFNKEEFSKKLERRLSKRPPSAVQQY